MFDFSSFLSNPQSMGLLGFAHGLMQAGQPSYQPIGLGSALSMGTGSALQNMLTAKHYGNQMQQHAMNQYMHAGAPNPLLQQPIFGMNVPTPSGLLAHSVAGMPGGLLHLSGYGYGPY